VISEVEETVLQNLAKAPFYASLLRNSVSDHLRRCQSPSGALKSRVIRQLYLGAKAWINAETSLVSVSADILHPERAFPRFKRRKTTLPAVQLSREFDQAMLDAFAAIESALYVIRDLGAGTVEMLKPKQGGPWPDAVATIGKDRFPIEAKRIRGAAGFYRLQDEIDSRRALNPEFLSGPSVSLKLHHGTPRDILDLLSDDNFTVLGDRFELMARRRQKGVTLAERVSLGQEHEATLELSDRSPLGLLSVHGAGGLIEPLDISYLETKAQEKIEEATIQLSAWHDDGKNRPTDLAFVQVELPDETLFHEGQAERQLEEIAARAGSRLRIRVKVAFAR
jgi:hypothetical protein